MWLLLRNKAKKERKSHCCEVKVRVDLTVGEFGISGCSKTRQYFPVLSHKQNEKFFILIPFQ